ncbi:MAG: hypothetical protein KBS96_06695 [Lachnospiraceae bacterium]|nr:hypothetical protein [Candidatus Colinaster scatohippi]
MNSQEQKILFNQVRHRILQFILHEGNATSREIGNKLSDIPQASLYRQMKTLSDNGFIVVSGQKRIRGTLECTYSLAPELVRGDGGSESELGIQFMLLSLAQEFDDYEGQKKDDELLDFVSAPVYMSDEEYKEYMREINELTKKYTQNRDNNCKNRRVTFVSTPA